MGLIPAIESRLEFDVWIHEVCPQNWRSEVQPHDQCWEIVCYESEVPRAFYEVPRRVSQCREVGTEKDIGGVNNLSVLQTRCNAEVLNVETFSR